MTDLSRESLQTLLQQAIEQSMEVAQAEVAEPLPRDVILELGAFDQAGQESSVDTVTSHLYRGGMFPKLVNVAVRGVSRGKTLIWIGPSGHAFVKDLSEAWNDPRGTGPFKPVGLMVKPPIWQRPRPLSLADMEEAAPDWVRERS